MISNRHPARLAAVALLSIFAGCTAPAGKDGKEGASALVVLTNEPAGANCANGGMRIDAGPDADADGVLDVGEITSTQYVCTGTPGQTGAGLLITSDVEPPGANCPDGGDRIQSGPDADRDGVLDAGEVAATQYLCDGAAGDVGFDSVITSQVEPSGANCQYGGVRIDTGLDTNRNASLDGTEVLSTSYVCFAQPPSDGLSSLVATAAEPPGANCVSGGTTVSSGMDADRDAVLDATEISSTTYVCGVTALVSVSNEPAGVNCANGGTRIDSGTDGDGDAVLDPAEVTATQYVCDGASPVSSLLVTAAEPAGANCQFGGTRIQSGPDTDGNGALDPAEVASTQYVCNGSGYATLVAFAVEPAGASCPYGGTAVNSGLDLDSDGVLDPSEITETGYVCTADSVHPTVEALTPPDGATVPPTAIFCARFSEPVDPATLADSMALIGPMTTAPVPGDITYTDATRTACFTPLAPLDLFSTYYLTVGGPGSAILDLAGNQLIREASSSYWIDTVAGAPELRVTIDSVTPGASTVDVAFTVWNDGSVDAVPFELGLFVDPAAAPTVGEAPDLAVSFASGLAAWTSQTGTVTLTATSGSEIWAFADVGGVVVETDEGNNVALLAPVPVMPTMTGSPSLVPATVEAGAPFEVTVPVNAVARRMDVFIAEDAFGSRLFLGTYFGNAAGEGYLAGSPVTPSTGWAGTWSVAIDVYDGTGSLMTQYFPNSGVSGSNYSAWDSYTGVEVDSGIPLSLATIVPATNPNLTMSIDTIIFGSGTIDVGYTVSNPGASDAGAFDVGLFLNPSSPPAVGSTPDSAVTVAALPAGMSTSGVFTVPGDATTRVSVYADAGGAVAEVTELDNLAEYVPWVGPSMTGSPTVTPAMVDAGATFDVSVPVSSTARNVDLFVGDALTGIYLFVGTALGNTGGEGTIAGTFTVPDFGGSWYLWACVYEDAAAAAGCYLSNPAVSTANYTFLGTAGTQVSTGIPLTPVTIVGRTFPAEWTCNAAYYGTADGCDCGCGALDPDCSDATVVSCQYCNDPGSCSTAAGCPGDIDPANNAVCSGVLAGWTCSAAAYGTGDGCNCGCGALDPDCADATVASCAYCDDAGSCSTTTCPGTIDPTNNVACTP